MICGSDRPFRSASSTPSAYSRAMFMHSRTASGARKGQTRRSRQGVIWGGGGWGSSPLSSLLRESDSHLNLVRFLSCCSILGASLGIPLPVSASSKRLACEDGLESIAHHLKHAVRMCPQ